MSQPTRPVPVEQAFLLSCLRDGYWRVDARGVVVEANDAMAEALGVPLTQLVGTSVRQWIAGVDGRPAGSPIFGGQAETLLRCRSGRPLSCHMNSLVLRGPEGEPDGAMQVFVLPQAPLEERLRSLQRLAEEDPLTGLPNRRAFDQALGEALLRRGSRPFALLLMDLDRFKQINDTLGHDAGDHALAAFARGLREAVREGDFVARIGGDEFAAILHGVTEAVCPEAVARLEPKLKQDLLLESGLVRLAASIGWSHSGPHAEQMLRVADQSMYEAKRLSGRAEQLPVVELPRSRATRTA